MTGRNAETDETSPAGSMALILQAAREVFFERLLCRGIPLRMIRTWLQPGEAPLAQPLDHGAFSHADGEAALDFAAQVNAAPADDFVDRGVRAVDLCPCAPPWRRIAASGVATQNSPTNGIR
jgi:hypothetical protein